MISADNNCILFKVACGGTHVKSTSEVGFIALKRVNIGGGTAIGDPACDLVIAWTYLEGSARDIFIKAMDLDEQTWLRARAWALWKATFELCQIKDKNSPEAKLQLRIINTVIQKSSA